MKLFKKVSSEKDLTFVVCYAKSSFRLNMYHPVIFMLPGSKQLVFGKYSFYDLI